MAFELEQETSTKSGPVFEGLRQNASRNLKNNVRHAVTLPPIWFPDRNRRPPEGSTSMYSADRSARAMCSDLPAAMISKA
jgi:hypothetical protein